MPAESVQQYVYFPNQGFSRVLRTNLLEDRQYQRTLADDALAENSLIVLPTGLGKTIIGSMVIAATLQERGGRALLLAPTRPLAQQHAATFSKLLDTGPVVCLTGSETPKKRARLWISSSVITATAQTAENDAKRGLVPVDLSAVIFDEAHRAVGNYAYVGFAAWLQEHCPRSRVLGLTASPGYEIEHIDEVRKNLHITKVRVRTREDPDVAPYVEKIDVDWIEVQPSEVILKCADYLTKALHAHLNALRRYGVLRDRKNDQVRIRDLNEATRQIFGRRLSGDRGPYLFQAVRRLSLAKMTMHAAATVQREGVDAFTRFIEPKFAKGRSRLDASFVNDLHVARAFKVAKRWKGPSHPKLEPLLVLLQQTGVPGKKVIVFAELRDTVDFLVDLLTRSGLRAERFVGQGSREGRKGMTQRQQQSLLQRFSAGEFPILCATSIAEEGLDIPQVDLVVFFEPVASDIRSIQRSGRTGRDAAGRVVVMTTNRSLDERYLWSGIKRERRMKRLVNKLASEAMQKSLAAPTDSTAG